MTSYFVGDKPRLPLTISVPSGAWTGATVYLDGVALTTTFDTSAATAQWPSDPFLTDGLYPVTVVATNGTAHQTFTAESIVAEAPDGWHTLATARADWTNNLSDVQLYTLLRIARVAVESFRPLGEDEAVPLRYRQAQLMQARNVLNASKSDPAQGADGELFVIRPYPLDLFIRELIQPRTAVPAVG
jgi:hypothetical protein